LCAGGGVEVPLELAVEGCEPVAGEGLGGFAAGGKAVDGWGLFGTGDEDGDEA